MFYSVCYKYGLVDVLQCVLWRLIFDYVDVYLISQVTVMHSLQAGYMDKAQKYTDKALMQIEKLKSKSIYQPLKLLTIVFVTSNNSMNSIKKPQFSLYDEVFNVYYIFQL